MEQRYGVVVAGDGQNGLTAAPYLGYVASRRLLRDLKKGHR